MDLNILKDLCGGMKDQEKLMDIVNDIKEDNLEHFLNFSNNQKDTLSLGGNKTYDNFTVRNRFSEFNHSIFGNYLISMNESKVDIQARLTLTTPWSEIDDFLGGGFQEGKIYELFGSSLTGKTNFLIHLISANVKKQPAKFLYIDTSCGFSYEKLAWINSKYNYNADGKLLKEKVVFVNAFDFKQLLNQLKTNIQGLRNKQFNFIIIDSLSLLASKIAIDNKSDLVSEFNTLIQSLVTKFSIGLIYTHCTSKIKDIAITNFEKIDESKNLSVKEYQHNLVPNLKLFPDYIFSLHYENSNCTILGLNSRRYFAILKSEKTMPGNTLVELNI